MRAPRARSKNPRCARDQKKKFVSTDTQVDMAFVSWLLGLRSRGAIVSSTSGRGYNGVAVLPLSMWSCFSATVWPPVSFGCVFRFAFALCCRFAFRMCSWPLRNMASSRLEFILSPYLFWAGARPGQAPLFLFEILLYPLHLLFFSLGYTMHSL